MHGVPPRYILDVNLATTPRAFFEKFTGQPSILIFPEFATLRCL